MVGTNRLRIALGTAVLAGIAAMTYVLAGAAPPDGPASLVEFAQDGKLRKPEGYRRWVYVGTPLTPNELNGGEAPFPDFHAVYIDPESFAHFEKTGEFRDGAVMIKELVAVGAKEATSGSGYFMGDFIGLEASIKDSKRFQDEPGHWGYFSFGHKYPLKAEAAKQDAAACNSCHQSSAAKDYVFTQFYPVLRAASPKTK
ncbi:cytochrome P460 family protein [Paludisphaera mucosa]|uniref:Cytochrome P460 family protein n=1 Tax=Paludisphaera mucosa TaxID=3030827 RepID=A0ABT6FGG3_9BACT|nr:cytochrome P460 family protein [Paludisphaera mucosa]MDG3006490.1 cytochrome P460 family protein [Paludisphaera mucosa]